MFAHSGVTDTKVAIDISGGGSNVYNTFRNAQFMKTIRKLIVDEKTRMDNNFINCRKLENLTIEGTIGQTFNAQYSPLSRASIENIVSCLSTTTKDLTCTLKTSAVNNAFTTEEWNVLIATKSNWTFALVD